MGKSVKKKGKKHYRLRKSVRRTLGALFMISAIIVAAIPVPDVAAEGEGSGGITPLAALKTPYIYTSQDSANSDIGDDLSCNDSTPKSQALYVRQNSDGSYTLLNQFDFFEKNFDGQTWGVISKYYDTYATSMVNLSSNVSKEYYTVTVTDFETYFASGDGSHDVTLNPVNEDSKALFQTFFNSKYQQYQQDVEQYNRDHQAWVDAGSDPASEPTPVAPPTVNPNNDLSRDQKRQYYCYENPELAGKGYTLEYVSDKRNTSGGATNNFIYVARGGNPPANMKNDDLGFLVKTTASIIAIGSTISGGNVMGAFSDVQNVDNLILPNEIKYIGDRAFEHCFIKEVTLEGVESIGDHAFKNSGDLSRVTMSSTSVSKIGIEAFYKCTALETIDFPNPLSVVEAGAFAECVNLKNVDFSKAKNAGGRIGDGAFYNCALENLIIDSSGMETVGDGAFATSTPSKDRLTNVNLESSNFRNIGKKLFSGRSNLIKVTMPAVYGVSDDPAIKLDNNTFTGCTNLGMLVFPSVCGRVTYDDDIFTNVTNDQFVVQGPAKDTTGLVAQERLATRKCLNANGNPVPYMYEEGGENFYEVKSGDYLLGLRVNNTDLTATVHSCDFEDRSSTPTTGGELNIPNNVGPYKVIGLEDGCFSEAVKEDLQQVIIKDDSLQVIGDSVFQGCTNIKNVKIGNSVTSIGQNAFNGCTSLETVTIGGNVTEIKDGAFSGCIKLENMVFETPLQGASSFPRENIGANALTTGSAKLTVTGILEEGYGPFEWSMDTTNYVDASMGIRVCYKTPSPQNLTVILDNQNNLPTLVDYPHYENLENIQIEVDNGSGGTITSNLRAQYESGGELTPVQEAMVRSTMYIDIPAGIQSIDVKGYLNDSSKQVDGVEPKTNGYNVSTYFTSLPYKDEYKTYGLFNGNTGDETDQASNQTESNEIGNDRIRSVTMHTVKYLPNSTESVPGDLLSQNGLSGGAFYSCENLEVVDLGSEMEDVGTLPFLGCYNLNSVASSSPNYVCNNKILYEKLPDSTDKIVEVLGSRGNANDGTVSTDNDADLANVSEIAEGAFSDCPTLRRADLTGNTMLTEVPDKCFLNDGKLSQVILPQNIRTIGQKALSECADNISLTIYGREVSLATDTFEGTDGATVYAYKDTAAFNTAKKIGVEVLPLDETYQVQFFDYDGITELTDIQYVAEGKDAEPPEEDPKREGYIFTGWNKSYKDVTEDRMILALYDIDPDQNNSNNGNNNNGNNNNGNNGSGNTGSSTTGEEKLYTLTVSNGTGSGKYKAGTTITITAGSGDSGKGFGYWSSSNKDIIFSDSTKPTTSLTMPASDATVIANFVGYYRLEVEYGSGSGSYPAGTTVAISAVAAPQGRTFASWTTKTTGLTIEDSKKSSTTITMPSSNAKVTATYRDTGSLSGNSTSGNKNNSQNGTSVIITKPGISDKNKASAYVTGSSDNFVVKISESQEAADAVQSALLQEYGDLSRIKYFAMDISLYDATGKNLITDTDNLKVNITMPIPDALKEYGGNNRVGAVANGALEKLNPKFTTIDGVPSVTFTATHFSPYTIYVDTGNITVGNTLDATPKTGDGIHPKWFLSIGLACISMILFLKKDRTYRTRVS